jgi:predicted methyltransferase
MTDGDIAKLHRVNRDLVVKEVTSVGFKLVDEGTFLHRPGDDHAKSLFDKSIQGAHRPICAEVREAGELGGLLPRRAPAPIDAAPRSQS